MNSRDLLTNQVVYLTALLSQRPELVDAESLRPTCLSLEQIRKTELSELSWPYIRQGRSALEEYVHQRQPVRLRAAQGVLFTLRQALTVLKGTSKGPTGGN